MQPESKTTQLTNSTVSLDTRTFQPGDHVWVKNLGGCVPEQKCILIRGDKSANAVVEEEKALFGQYLLVAAGGHRAQGPTLPLQFDQGTHVKVTQVQGSDSNHVKWRLDRNFSVSMWMKRTGNRSSGCLVSKSDDKKNQWRLTLDKDGALEVASMVDGQEMSVTTAPFHHCCVKPGKWYHVCATCSHVKVGIQTLCHLELWANIVHRVPRFATNVQLGTNPLKIQLPTKQPV
jgi:hypothetical protein